MQAEIGCMHGRYRMIAHNGMTIKPVDMSLIAGKQVARECVALQLRRTNDKGNNRLVENAGADLGGAANASDVRTGVEGGAHFVMAKRGVKRFQPV